MSPEQIEMLKRTLTGVDMSYCTVEEVEILQFLLRHGLCEKPRENKTVLYASRKGIERLFEYKDMLKQPTKKKRRQRSSNDVFIKFVLIPFFTFVLGVLLEHFFCLVSWFISFF